MALDPSEAAGLPDELIALYTQAELALMTMLAHAIVAGIDTPEWEARQPAEMLRFKQQAQLMAVQLQAQMPALVEGAVAGASERGREAADEDLKSVPKALPIPPESPERDKKTRAAIFAGQQVLSMVTHRIPGAAGELHTQVTGQIIARHTGATGTRIDAAQQALDILTKRGITGFKDASGRNWSLSSYIEMKSRTIVNQQLIDGHTDRMLERGQNLIVVSSHSNPAPQCQPYEGQVLSLDGETGTVIRPSAVGGKAVKVQIKATLKDARSHGFQHPNCGHAVSAYVAGASRTFKTEPDPKGYEAKQKQRAMERAIRDTKRSQTVAVTPQRKKELAQRLKAQRAALATHVEDNNLKRLPARESIAGVHKFGRPGDPGNPTAANPRGPVKPPPPPAPPKTGGTGGGDEPPRQHIAFGRRIEATRLGSLGAEDVDPPSRQLLEEGGLIATDANPGLYHDEKERYTTKWLTARGIRTHSVDRRTDKGAKTPDSVLDDSTLELKMLARPKNSPPDWVPASNGVSNIIRKARKQSSRVVVDGRRVGLTAETAEAGMRDALRKYGEQLDEVLIILGDNADDAISWSHG